MTTLLENRGSAARRWTALFSVVIATSTASIARGQGATEAEKTERTVRTEIVKGWLDLAQLAVTSGDKASAQRALDEAGRFGPPGAAATALQERAAALTEAAEVPEVRKKEAATRLKVVAALDRLSKLKLPSAAAQRIEEYFWMGFELDPGNKERRARLQKLLSATAKEARFEEGRRLLRGARRWDPEGCALPAFGDAESVIGRAEFLDVEAPGHPMRGLLLLPPGFTPKKSWPLVVYIDGALSAFEKAAREHRATVNEHGCLLLVPITLSNANEIVPGRYPYPPEMISSFKPQTERGKCIEWDVAGLDGLLGWMRERFHVEGGLHFTCWSGGGMLTYWWIQNRPQDIASAAPASANFYAHLNGKPERIDGGPPVRIYTGSLDSAGQERIFPQSDAAVASLRAQGFSNVERIHLDGRDHERFTELVFPFLAQTWRKR